MNEKEFCQKYLDLLTGEFKGLNLTRILDGDEFYQKQYLDSILPWKHSDCFRAVTLKTKIFLDVGFGGGFPLLPISYLGQRSFRSIGLDSRRKKVEAVNFISGELGLDAKCFHHRLEDVHIDRPCLISFKAVGLINDLLSKIMTDKVVTAFFYKGPSVYNLENPHKPLKGWRLIEEKAISLEGTEGRIFLAYQNVPRGTKRCLALKTKLSKLQ